MLQVETLTLGELATNCYIAWCPRTLQAVIIDPADSGDFISERILALQVQPIAILLTHGHFDHVLGLLEVKLNFEVPIYLHPADNTLLANVRASTQHWLHRDPGPIPIADATLKANQRLKIGNESLEVMLTPGHTPGSVCFYNKELIFTGDTLFADGVGRTDFAYSNPSELKKSLQKIVALPAHLPIYPGHGDSTRLLVSRQTVKN
jgi:hydroxyacylglutathione hydrolase